MITSAFGAKHQIHWTAGMQLDDLDFEDDLELLSQTQQRMQEKAISVAATSAAVGLKIHKVKSRFSDTTQHATIESHLKICRM
ncbi:unnamed protein product [Schistosoma margrebowiei]|uniref:Uncharacterized protein n=1 Tax=Schistosoma margrebowiei TaxID=48269 RepID=A0A183LPN9_9TREM|nr:unnamed protein product [Schistosoma margrebowiei]